MIGYVGSFCAMPVHAKKIKFDATATVGHQDLTIASTIFTLHYRPHMHLKFLPPRSQERTNTHPCGNACVPNKNGNYERHGNRTWKCKWDLQTFATSGWIIQKVTRYTGADNFVNNLK